MCPIDGQIRKFCASHPNCTKTCSNTNGSAMCPEICIFNGCECPNGTVVDEKNKECVLPNNCNLSGMPVNYNKLLRYCEKFALS